MHAAIEINQLSVAGLVKIGPLDNNSIEPVTPRTESVSPTDITRIHVGVVVDEVRSSSNHGDDHDRWRWV